MMQIRLAILPFLGGLVVLTGGCASASGDYPSLAFRDGERWAGTFDVAEAEPYVPEPPAAETVERTVQLAREARSAHDEFLAAAPEAERQTFAAQSAGVGSEAWSVAQVALANLESRRSRAMIALADLDRIYVDTSTAGEAIAPIADVRGEVAALIDTENALITRLAARLSR